MACNSGGNKTCVQGYLWVNIVPADVLNSEPRFSFRKNDSFKRFLRHSGGSTDADNQNAAVGICKRRQCLLQFPLYAVVKSGLVFNSRVFVKSSAELLYIFELEIRNWFREEHGRFLAPEPETSTTQLALVQNGRQSKADFHFPGPGTPTSTTEGVQL